MCMEFNVLLVPLANKEPAWNPLTLLVVIFMYRHQ